MMRRRRRKEKKKGEKEGGRMSVVSGEQREVVKFVFRANS